MTDRTNTHRGEASKKNQKKGGKRQNLQQYYADDMIEEDKKVPLNTQQRHLMMDEEEEEVEVINLEDNQSKERLNKENMDKISDILVSMIYKNVILIATHPLKGCSNLRKSTLKTLLMFLFLMSSI